MVPDPRRDGLDRWNVEPSEHEPDEWNPEADYRDPETDSITIPDVSVPDVRIPEVTPPEQETDEFDVPSDLLEAFWAVVIVINGAVLAVSIGAMLIGFRGDLRNGGILLAAGIVLFGFAARRYRHLRDGDFSDGNSSDTDTGVGASDTDADGDPSGAATGGEYDEIDAPRVDEMTDATRRDDEIDGDESPVDGSDTDPSNGSTPAETNSSTDFEPTTPNQTDRTNEDRT